MESEPDVTERPSFTISVWFLEMRVYFILDPGLLGVKGR